MDKRIKYLIGLDTETCNSLNDALVYDIGWVVADKRGNIYRRRSYVVREIFMGMANLMRSAYYSEKIPNYMMDIFDGKREILPLFEIRDILREDMREYCADTVFAHNARFDINALNSTIRYITASDSRYFLPYNIEVWDTMKAAQSTIAKQKSYIEWCAEHGFETTHKNPRPRVTVEILHRYLTGNMDFEESHTGLEDAEIETQILAHCLKQHKTADIILYRKRG